MSIWNKILIGFISIGALGFVYQASVVLKINQHWRDSVKQHEEKLAKVQEENILLVDADEDNVDAPLGIRRLKIQQHRLLVNRGRVWYNCEPAQGGAAGITVAISEPNPHGISDKSILYVFEEAAEAGGGRYVGEFVVTLVDDDNNQVVLQPTTKLLPKEVALLTDALATGPWTLYGNMPLDTRYVFEDLEDDEKQAALPGDAVDEYIKDGNDAGVDDPEELTVDGKYVRRLRDYDVLFRKYKAGSRALIDRIAVVERDNVYIDAALVNARKQVAFRKQEVTELAARRDNFRREVAAINAHGRVLYNKLSAIKATVFRLIAENESLAEDITRTQIAARDRIDARTRRLVKSAGQPE